MLSPYLLTNLTSSFVQNNQTSSFTTTSSFNAFTSSINTATSSFVRNNQTSSFVQNSQTSSFVQNSQTSSMLSPYLLTSRTSSFATTGSNTFIGNQIVTGSLIAPTITGSLLGTASLAATASYTISSSYAVSSSFSETAASVPTYETPWIPYTPSWTSLDTPQPILGNGTLTGNYKVIGKICFVRVKLTFGLTTNGGSNTWLFGLPIAAITPDAIQLPCSIQNSEQESQWYTGTVSGTYQGTTTTSAVLVNSFPATPVNATYPFIWNTLDSLQFNGSYEIA
jgi:hypothetical protein